MEEKIRLAVFGQKRLSREGGIEIVVKELCTRMAQNGCDITCYNRAGHHVSGAEYDKTIEYDGMYTTPKRLQKRKTGICRIFTVTRENRVLHCGNEMRLSE